MADGPSKIHVPPEGRAVIVNAFGRDPKHADGFLASGDAADLEFEEIPLKQELQTRIRNTTEYLQALSKWGIGGDGLKKALKRHKDEAGLKLTGGVSNHPYSSALFAFDESTQRLFDSSKLAVGLSKTDPPRLWECSPIWTKYSTDISVDDVENTAVVSMNYLYGLSLNLMLARLGSSKDSTLEEKLLVLAQVVAILKKIKPGNINWNSISNLENPDFFPKLKFENDLEETLGPIPRTVEFIGDEEMLALNLIKAAFNIANTGTEKMNVTSKIDRDRARAYFEEHREEMGERAYIWDNLLKEVFDRADVIFPNEEVVDRERRAVVQRSEEALGQPGYADHYYGEYFEALHGNLPMGEDQDALQSLKSKDLTFYKAIKKRLAEARHWLTEHQLDSSKTLEILQRYEDDWDLHVRLLEADIYTMPGSTCCVLFALSPKLDKKVREDVQAYNMIDIHNTSLESRLAVWGRLTVKPKGMRAQRFLDYYEKLHELLFSTIQNIAQMQNRNDLAGFAFFLNNLMLLFKIDNSKRKTIKIDKFRPIIKAAHNVYGRRFDTEKRPMEVYVNEEILLYLIIDACNKLVMHAERDPYNKSDREDTLAEMLELSRSKGVVPDENDKTPARDFELSIKFLQGQLPKIFALADEMFANKKISRPEGAVAEQPVEAAATESSGPAATEAPVAIPPAPPLDAPPDEDDDRYDELPGGADAILPPDYETGPLEIRTLEELTNMLPIVVMSKKQKEDRRRRWQADAALAKSNCDARATVVAGDFEGTAHVTHATVKEIFIQRRNPEAIVFPSNLNCTGTVKLETNGKTSYILHWQLDEKGQLAFVIGDKTYNEQAFSQGAPKLKNFYLETHSIILQQLEKLLVRQERELNARTWGAVLPSEEIDKVKPVKTRGGAEIRPRFEDLIGAVSDGDGKAGPTVTVVGRKAIELLEMIRAKQPIFEDDANGIILYLKLDEKVEAGKRVEPLYMPCNTIQVLRAVANGKISLDEVFVMSSRHRVGRAGYHPHRDSENPHLLVCTQRVQGEASEAVRQAIEGHFKVKLATDVTNATAITIPKDGEAIEAIVIGTKEQITANDADTILMQEIERWVSVKGEKDAISQTAMARIRAVVIETENGEKQLITPEEILQLTRFKIFRVIFNAEQRPQFTIGTYESLAEVERKLATAEPAAFETAPV